MEHTTVESTDIENPTYKTCPLSKDRSGACLKDQCEWWLEKAYLDGYITVNYDGCAVPILARRLLFRITQT